MQEVTEDSVQKEKPQVASPLKLGDLWLTPLSVISDGQHSLFDFYSGLQKAVHVYTCEASRCCRLPFHSSIIADVVALSVQCP